MADRQVADPGLTEAEARALMVCDCELADEDAWISGIAKLRAVLPQGRRVLGTVEQTEGPPTGMLPVLSSGGAERPVTAQGFAPDTSMPSKSVTKELRAKLDRRNLALTRINTWGCLTERERDIRDIAREQQPDMDEREVEAVRAALDELAPAPTEPEGEKARWGEVRDRARAAVAEVEKPWRDDEEAAALIEAATGDPPAVEGQEGERSESALPYSWASRGRAEHLAAALHRVEQERDEANDEAVELIETVKEWRDRAEKAERRLARIEEGGTDAD